MKTAARRPDYEGYYSEGTYKSPSYTYSSGNDVNVPWRYQDPNEKEIGTTGESRWKYSLPTCEPHTNLKDDGTGLICYTIPKKGEASYDDSFLLGDDELTTIRKLDGHWTHEFV